MEDAKILIANTAMDTDKIKVGCIKMKFSCFWKYVEQASLNTDKLCINMKMYSWMFDLVC